MTGKVHITDRDKGYKALVKTVFEFEKPVITVGIHAAEGQQVYEKGSGQKASVVDVATFNEFGLGVPERSFVRAWYDNTTEENKAFIVQQLQLVIKGKITKDQALERMGLKFQSAMQQNISDGGNPPFQANAQSTIDRKGSSSPLIDSGQLRSSITFSVKE